MTDLAKTKYERAAENLTIKADFAIKCLDLLLVQCGLDENEAEAVLRMALAEITYRPQIRLPGPRRSIITEQ